MEQRIAAARHNCCRTPVWSTANRGPGIGKQCLQQTKHYTLLWYNTTAHASSHHLLLHA